jgi:hypothetical protein
MLKELFEERKVIKEEIKNLKEEREYLMYREPIFKNFIQSLQQKLSESEEEKKEVISEFVRGGLGERELNLARQEFDKATKELAEAEEVVSAFVAQTDKFQQKKFKLHESLRANGEKIFKHLYLEKKEKMIQTITPTVLELFAIRDGYNRISVDCFLNENLKPVLERNRNMIFKIRSDILTDPLIDTE